VGYSMPHPSEMRVQLRVQTKGARAVDVVSKALDNLVASSDLLAERFSAAVDEASGSA